MKAYIVKELSVTEDWLTTNNGVVKQVKDAFHPVDCAVDNVQFSKYLDRHHARSVYKSRCIIPPELYIEVNAKCILESQSENRECNLQVNVELFGTWLEHFGFLEGMGSESHVMINVMNDEGMSLVDVIHGQSSQSKMEEFLLTKCVIRGTFQLWLRSKDSLQANFMNNFKIQISVLLDVKGFRAFTTIENTIAECKKKSDEIIRTKDGMRFACHRAKINDNVQIAFAKTLALMSEMSTATVKAFLKFQYASETDDPDRDTRICVELLKFSKEMCNAKLYVAMWNVLDNVADYEIGPQELADVCMISYNDETFEKK